MLRPMPSRHHDPLPLATLRCIRATLQRGRFHHRVDPRAEAQTQPALATAADARERLIVARVGSLPRLTASSARDGEDRSRLGRHGDACPVPVSSSAIATTGGANREAVRAQNAVRG